MARPLENINVNDTEYDENEDDDYDPKQAVADDDVSSSSDDEAPAENSQSRPEGLKRKRQDSEELDSGDEATIKERRRRRRKAVKDDESGGEGGLIKTRAQRLAEQSERQGRHRADAGRVTVDVGALWADLNSLPVGRSAAPKVSSSEFNVTRIPSKADPVSLSSHPDGLIKIKRRIEFAGVISEVEEEVLRSSKQAQRYLEENPEDSQVGSSRQSRKDGLRRPLRRPSLFEPNPLAIVKGVAPDKLRRRAPTRLDVLMAERHAEMERKKKIERMSTVQKSALDWRGFVTDQGYGEELDEYGKSKMGFLAREHFLDKVHGANEDARRAARLKG